MTRGENLVEHFLLPYVLRAKELHARDWLQLEDIAAQADSASFVEWIHGELDDAKQAGLISKGNRRLLGVSDVSLHSEPFSLVEGRIEGGGTGILSRGIDTSQGAGNVEVYKRKPWMADLQPFYFGICDTPDSTAAIAMIHAIGKSGIKGPLQEFLQGRLHHLNEDLRIHMEPLVPPGSPFDQLSSDEILRLEYRKKQAAGDIGDLPFTTNSKRLVTVTLELKVYGDGLPFRQKARKARLEELAATHAMFGQEFEEIRADVLIGGKKRTIRLDNPGNLQPRYDLGDYLDPKVLNDDELAEEVDRVYAEVKAEARDYLSHHRQQFEAG